VSSSCEDANFLASVNRFLKVDDQASMVGELGIGLNPKARLTGNLLEDEKAGETAHIAFGNNEDMSGGKNTSTTHRDFLFYKPTITVTYIDGKVRDLMRNGEVL